MRRFFRKLNAPKEETDVFQTVSQVLNSYLHQFAGYLNGKAIGLKQGRIAALIFSFCLVIAVCFAIHLFYSLKHSVSFNLHTIEIPLVKFDASPHSFDIVIRRIRNFHRYMDSLKVSDPSSYDSIIQARPHLMDSIIIIEQINNN